MQLLACQHDPVLTGQAIPCNNVFHVSSCSSQRCLLPKNMHFLQILVVEGLHPFYDERVRDLLDFKLYLDISDDVKFAWKLQRDSQERGHSVESIKQSIESRKPDFDAYIDPQKKHADIILQVPANYYPCMQSHVESLL